MTPRESRGLQQQMYQQQQQTLHRRLQQSLHYCLQQSLYYWLQTGLQQHPAGRSARSLSAVSL